MSDSTKICPACAESIKPTAKICPRCRQWQTIWSIHNPVTQFLGVFACFIAVGVSFLVFLGRIVNPGPDFTAFRDQIVVTGTKLNVQQTEKDRLVVVVGTVTNRSAIAWKDLEFECRFFGINGDLIDARTHMPRMTILGRDEVAFRADTKATRPLVEYASHQVVVRSARNAKAVP